MKTTIDFFCIAISYLRMGGGGGGKECGYDTVGWQKTKSILQQSSLNLIRESDPRVKLLNSRK